MPTMKTPNKHENANSALSTAACSTLSEPRIVCAAYKMQDGFTLPGVRHWSPDMRATAQRLYGDRYHLQVDRAHHEGGFIDQHGRYYNRQDAWKIAERNGQILKEVSIEGTLYSENLY